MPYIDREALPFVSAFARLPKEKQVEVVRENRTNGFPASVELLVRLDKENREGSSIQASTKS